MRQFFGDDGAGGSNSSSLNLPIAELFTASSLSYYHIIFFYLTHPAVYRLKTITAMTNVVKTTKRVAFTLLSSAALLSPLTITSCQDYEPFDEAEVRETFAKKNYDVAFVEAFGDIAPGQDWGFEPIPFLTIDATRGANTNSNEWATVYHFDVPGGSESDQSKPWGWTAGDVTQYERAYVYWWFSTHRWPKTLTVDWRYFFVENVWGQPEHSGIYADGSSANTQFNPTFGMDYLTIQEMDGVPQSVPTYQPSKVDITDSNAKLFDITNWSDITTYEHINDYNAGGGMKEQVMYVFDVSTEDFGYRASFNNEIHNNWTIQYINGNYYLGFDYWHDKKNTDNCAEVAPDGYYNDWIIKLQSGTHQVDEYTRRIMCEDLGNSFDWDFNDVIFDVTAVEKDGRKYAMITVQAVGGTLPIYIGDDPKVSGTQARELHGLFGVSVNTPVNVHAAGDVKRPAVVFTLECKSEWIVDNKLDIEKIPVWVDHSANAAEHANASGKGDYWKLDAEKDRAPHKIACPSNTYWMQEFKNISETNDLFIDWVKGIHTNFPSCDAENEIYNVQDRWVISSTHRYDKFDRSVHYEDNGRPYSNANNSSDAQGYSSVVKPWRTIWTEMVTAGGLNNTAFTQDYVYIKDPQNNTTYTRNFISQAPYIYTQEGKNKGEDDLTLAYSPDRMGGNEGALKYWETNGDPMTVVWPVLKTVSVVVEGEGGSVQGGGSYTVGSKITISANPFWGYKFIQWSDGVKEATRTITVTDDATYTATFAQVVQITISNQGNGHVLLNDGQHVYNQSFDFAVGEVIKMQAISDQGWHFVRWSDDNTENPRTYTIQPSDNPSEFKAIFEQNNN